ncbi:MAG: adenosine kinase [Parvularculaceae bacterium]
MNDPTRPALDVIGVGNAIVDVLAEASDAFLVELGIDKGGMTLIDEARAKAIYDAMPPAVEISGGSAANTIACLASLGGAGGFIGKVAADALGDIFEHDLKSIGVAFESARLEGGPATARSLINVTPDAQRSMSTYLGAAGLVGPEDVSPDAVANAAITYFEGYLFESETARAAFEKACAAAKAAGRRTALTLSDRGVVERNLYTLRDFIPANVDILFANEDEAAALFETTDRAAMAEAARELCALTAITRSAEGSTLAPRDGSTVDVPATPPAELVDTTGAGDAYAAGVLFGLARERSLADAGALGALAAAEIISHYGARPQTSLKELAAAKGLL